MVRICGTCEFVLSSHLIVLNCQGGFESSHRFAVSQAESCRHAASTRHSGTREYKILRYRSTRCPVILASCSDYKRMYDPIGIWRYFRRQKGFLFFNFLVVSMSVKLLFAKNKKKIWHCRQKYQNGNKVKITKLSYFCRALMLSKRVLWIKNIVLFLVKLNSILKWINFK